jgi:hypothetical protein
MAQAKPKKPTEYLTGQSALYVPRCPLCEAPIDLQATVESFGAPQGWQFYGYQGERWIKCRGESGAYQFTHFITLLNGRHSHRLAWIKAAVDVEATQESFL